MHREQFYILTLIILDVKNLQFLKDWYGQGQQPILVTCFGKRRIVQASKEYIALSIVHNMQRCDPTTKQLRLRLSLLPRPRVSQSIFLRPEHNGPHGPVGLGLNHRKDIKISFFLNPNKYFEKKINFQKDYNFNV
ncbi:hypothetical protein ABPG74_016050 [Tetrahymena malaccensis]